jgi:cysteine desulfurase family protein
MTNFIANIGTNIHRGLGKSFEAEEVVYNTRELLCQLFHFNKPENVIFTKNITESLNLLIKGLLQPGDHVIVSSMEHNAVMRPLTSLAAKEVTFSRIAANNKGEMETEDIQRLILPNTKAIIMIHGSNVSGNIYPLAQIGEICRKNKLFLIVDTAQTAGFTQVDMEDFGIDGLAFTGHKSLLGPQGIGGLLITDRLAVKVAPFIEGGTGTHSDSEAQPLYLPDKYEAGTLNMPGIFGLHAALKYLLSTGLKTIYDYENHLTALFISDLRNMQGVNLIGPLNIEMRTPLVSVDFANYDNAEVANRLLSDYNIITRVGLHCAPNAHKTLGTFPQGTVRFSFSSFNTPDDIKKVVNALNNSLK